MSELIKLNEEILQLEMKLLENNKIALDNKKSIELAKFVFKNSLDKKEYSNEEKREIAANNEIGIATTIKELQNFEFQNKILVIERDYKLRMLNILLHSELIE